MFAVEIPFLCAQRVCQPGCGCGRGLVRAVRAPTIATLTLKFTHTNNPQLVLNFGFLALLILHSADSSGISKTLAHLLQVKAGIENLFLLENCVLRNNFA